MVKRKFKEIRKELFEVLSDGKEHSFGDLERKVDTNWQTIRSHCENLLFFRAVSISNNKVKITKEGRELSRKL